MYPQEDFRGNQKYIPLRKIKKKNVSKITHFHHVYDMNIFNLREFKDFSYLAEM